MYQKLLINFLHCFFCCTIIQAQTVVPNYYSQQKKFTEALLHIIQRSGLDSNFNTGDDGIKTISFAVIDLTGDKALFGGVHFDSFIYPASVYKMYVAMEVLKQISEGRHSLYESYIVRSPNDVDKIAQISYDPRHVLKNGDTVTINYLLDLMITRSDNSAANCMIDIAGRKNINYTLHENGWQGSEVTRKFLKRKYEDEGYDTIKGTETCALHAADFMYKIYKNSLINPWVSMQLKSFLGRQLDTTKLSTGLPPNVMFYHKTGWWSDFTNDVGIVEDGHIKYIISLFVPQSEDKARNKMKLVSREVYALIKGRHENLY